MHLGEIFADGELDEAATCKDYLQVRLKGTRSVQRTLKHHSLPAILAVGYRVRLLRGTQFRQLGDEPVDRVPGGRVHPRR
ncbi:MAG: RhuM family protein [Planctomycetota bacterium]